MKKQQFDQRGFTLIELLVVIAVIGILASVVLASLNTARSKARDAERLSDMKQVQTALELYYNDNGSYPYNNSTWWGGCAGFGAHDTSGANGYIPNLAPKYIPVLPTDPKPADTSSCYLYASSGTDYMFMAYRNVEGSLIPGLVRPLIPTEKDYAMYTPGASGW